MLGYLLIVSMLIIWKPLAVIHPDYLLKLLTNVIKKILFITTKSSLRMYDMILY